MAFHRIVMVLLFLFLSTVSTFSCGNCNVSNFTAHGTQKESCSFISTSDGHKSDSVSSRNDKKLSLPPVRPPPYAMCCSFYHVIVHRHTYIDNTYIHTYKDTLQLPLSGFGQDNGTSRRQQSCTVLSCRYCTIVPGKPGTVYNIALVYCAPQSERTLLSFEQPRRCSVSCSGKSDNNELQTRTKATTDWPWPVFFYWSLSGTVELGKHQF